MRRVGYPPAGQGQVVGLLGGSFDPAHDGHVRITRAAIARFGLDRVWWVVSPGNPLKAEGPAPLAERIDRARRLMRHPKVTVTDIESRLGTTYTAQTLAKLQAIYPGVRFVWLMGADNLWQLDQWQDWHEIVARVPLGVLARPEQRLRARFSKAARIYSGARVKGDEVFALGRLPAPAWAFVNLPMSDLSSTAIRKSGSWRGAIRREGPQT